MCIENEKFRNIQSYNSTDYSTVTAIFSIFPKHSRDFRKID